MKNSQESNHNKKKGAVTHQKQRKAVYSIIDYEDNSKSYWLRLGTAYLNQDNSLTVHLDALPTNNRLHIRDIPNHHK